MKRLIFILAYCIILSAAGQRWKADSTYIRFYSKAPLEDIEAVNAKSSSIVDLDTKAIVMVIPISSFEFKKKLMREHFNENYLESEKYPNALFKGRFKDWDGSEGEVRATATGTLEMHGEVRDVEIEGDLFFDGDSLRLTSVFPIRLEDYKIKIPKAVFYNIAEEVEVTAQFNYKPYEKN